MLRADLPAASQASFPRESGGHARAPAVINYYVQANLEAKKDPYEGLQPAMTGRVRCVEASVRQLAAAPELVA